MLARLDVKTRRASRRTNLEAGSRVRALRLGGGEVASEPRFRLHGVRFGLGHCGSQPLPLPEVFAEFVGQGLGGREATRRGWWTWMSATAGLLETLPGGPKAYLGGTRGVGGPGCDANG